MPTPTNAPYKKAQRKAKKTTAKVLWVSCTIGEYMGTPGAIKHKVQGTYRRKNPKLPKGKADVKAEKRARHSKKHYYIERYFDDLFDGLFDGLFGQLRLPQ